MAAKHVPPLGAPDAFESLAQRRFLLFYPVSILTIRNHWSRIMIYGKAGRQAGASYESFAANARP